jgi:hypothetical protein
VPETVPKAVPDIRKAFGRRCRTFARRKAVPDIRENETVPETVPEGKAVPDIREDGAGHPKTGRLEDGAGHPKTGRLYRQTGRRCWT